MVKAAVNEDYEEEGGDKKIGMAEKARTGPVDAPPAAQKGAEQKVGAFLGPGAGGPDF